jgi:hypothetical protein
MWPLRADRASYAAHLNLLAHEQVETTQMYLHADLAIKERALARTKPLDSKPGRNRPPDALLGFLDGL